MELKIYFGNKPVFLCDELSPELKELNKHPDVVLVEELSGHAIHALLHEIKKDSFHAGILLHTDFGALKSKFFHRFTCLEASGGITLNTKGELLFIFRRGKWDLPKGKLEPGENPEQGAMREIEEETGIKGLEIIRKIGETYHSYEEFGKEILKTNHWYLLRTGDQAVPKGQAEEDITEAKWSKPDQLQAILSNTFPSISDILDRYLKNPH
jgi:8-oxo-dGTP pyrophosphatase MutT (NUDIX family)